MGEPLLDVPGVHEATSAAVVAVLVQVVVTKFGAALVVVPVVQDAIGATAATVVVAQVVTMKFGEPVEPAVQLATGVSGETSRVLQLMLPPGVHDATGVSRSVKPS